MSAPILVRDTPTSLSILDGTQELGIYSWDGLWQHPHWHPLRTRRSGAVLTSRAPYDHPWHCGHWWSWKQIDEVMCWNPALHGETATAGARIVATSVEGSTIIQDVDWRHHQSGEDLLHEQRRMRIELLDDDSWAIAWDITCTSRKPRVLSSTPWPEPNWGGYAGISFRPARSLAFEEEVRLRDGEGRIHSGDGCHGRHGPWLAYRGALDGVALPRAPRPVPLGGIALFAHPANPVPGERWWATGTANNHARFFCLGSGFLMGNTLTLEPGRPLRFRYRCVMTDGVQTPERLDDWACWRD